MRLRPRGAEFWDFAIASPRLSSILDSGVYALNHKRAPSVV